MKPDREPYARIIVAIVTLAVLPTLGIAHFGPADWFTNLQNWQSGLGAYLGALFGLGAILIGALFNAGLNRARDDRQREQELRALAGALRSEVRSVASDTNQLYKVMLDNYPDDNFEIANHAEQAMILARLHFPVFSANVGKLGMMDAHLAADIVEFYRSARAALTHLAEMGPGPPPVGVEINIMNSFPVMGNALARKLTETGQLPPEP